MVKIGLIGAGMIGQVAHLANFSEIDGCRVVAIAELREGLGEEAARKFGVPAVYPSHRELLRDPDIDAVVVVTRRPATGPIVLDALRAGKHVLSEKPMAHTVEQAMRLVTAAAERDLVYAIGFMKRYDAGVQRAKELLRALCAGREIGPVAFVRAYCFAGGTTSGSGGFVMTGEERSEGIELWPTAPPWLPDDLADQYAGFLNVYLHTINLLRFLLDATPTVTFVDFRHRLGQVAGLDFGQFSAVLELGSLPSTGDWHEGIEIVFERGKLTIELPQPLLRGIPATVRLYRAGNEGQTTTFVAEPSWAFRRQAEAFVRSVAERSEPIAGARDAVADLELAEEMFRRHFEWRPVRRKDRVAG
jgi:predicted dehydrogenase